LGLPAAAAAFQAPAAVIQSVSADTHQTAWNTEKSLHTSWCSWDAEVFPGKDFQCWEVVWSGPVDVWSDLQLQVQIATMNYTV